MSRRDHIARAIMIALSPAVLLNAVGCAKPIGPPLRIATWNVHACQAGLDAVVQQIREIDPDVICLQEVESGALESPGPDQGTQLAEKLGMYCYSSGPPEKGSNFEEMAILSKLPLTDTRTFTARTHRDYAVAGTIEWAGRPLRIICVHFSSTLTDTLVNFFKTGKRRWKEARALVRKIDRMSGDLVVLGDLNAVFAQPEHYLLASRLAWAPIFQPTHPSDVPIMQVDHIYRRGDVRVQNIRRVQTKASDHWMLVADLVPVASSSTTTQPAAR